MENVSEKYETALWPRLKVLKKYRKCMKLRQGPGPKYGKVLNKYEIAPRRRPQVWTKYGTNMKLHQRASPKYRKCIEHMKLHHGAGPKYGTSIEKILDCARLLAQRMVYIFNKYQTSSGRRPKVANK